MKLSAGEPPDKPWSWEVSVHVIEEQRRAVVDDVVVIESEDSHYVLPLSRMLTAECQGGHWVGIRELP